MAAVSPASLPKPARISSISFLMRRAIGGASTGAMGVFRKPDNIVDRKPSGPFAQRRQDHGTRPTIGRAIAQRGRHATERSAVPSDRAHEPVAEALLSNREERPG